MRDRARDTGGPRPKWPKRPCCGRSAKWHGSCSLSEYTRRAPCHGCARCLPPSIAATPFTDNISGRALPVVAPRELLDAAPGGLDPRNVMNAPLTLRSLSKLVLMAAAVATLALTAVA